MRKLTILAGLTLIGAGMSASVSAQGWFQICLDPANTAPYSDPYGIIGPDPTPLFSGVVGLFGTVTYGGTAGPCYNPARTLDAQGRLAFGIGAEGSVQSSFDNNLALTTGWPQDPVGDFTFVRFTINSETPTGSALFGDGGVRSFFVGASRRYTEVGWGNANIDVTLQMRLIGDAARLRWRVRNVAADATSVGMLFGCYAGMVSQSPDTGGSGNNFIANSSLFTALGPVNRFPDRYAGWTVVPSGKPLRTERLWFQNDQDFPTNVKFLFGQTNAYGMRVDNLPPAETPDATPADFMVVGNHGFPGPGILNNNNMRLAVFGDPTGTQRSADLLLDSVAFIQRFPGRLLSPGETRDIVHYVRAAQSVASYTDPYTIVLDAPRLLSFQDNQTGFRPNPATVRLWIDNQFATIDKEVPLQNIRASIILPAGVTLAPGQQQTKFLSRIDPNQMDFIDWQITTNGTTYGDVPIRVTITPTPGPTKTIQTTMRIANAPTYTFNTGPNLSSFPYRFGDASLDAILGLQAGRDYVAYTYDGDLRGYTPTQSVQRGVGYWIVPTSSLGQRALNGALPPSDSGQGGLLVSMKQGWNLIGNPYNYPVRLDELTAVAEDAPSDALTWKELVEGQFVQGSLAQWTLDPSQPQGGSYTFTSGLNAIIEPHRGYWIFVNTSRPIRLIFPPVFFETLPDSGRSTAPTSWKQTDKQWRLQISARSNSGMDAQNFVGLAPDPKAAAQLSLPKPPAAPRQMLEVAIIDEAKGNSRMSQAFTERNGRKEWKLQVKAEEAGEVTLTWPNLPSVPRNMRFRLKDDVTGEVTDLRATSGLTLRVNQPGTRSLTLSMEAGGSTRPVIGNVVVTRDSRDANSPVSINYSLSADALVTVRVLSNSGREVFTVTRSRSVGAGENNVTWTLKDNANRAVAPGTYRIEILAETPNGDRLRKIVPVNVVR